MDAAINDLAVYKEIVYSKSALNIVVSLLELCEIMYNETIL